jgi:periplasmic protein TonB
MSSTNSARKDTGRQSDLLLWVAGGGVAAVGVAWLLISQPWSSGDARSVAVTQDPPLPALAVLEPTAPDQSAGLETTLDNPLRMAQLAFEAGMLVEPEEYSAWTLYSKVAEDDPSNAAALDGLSKVAEELVQRGETALEQGRFDDARSTVNRILAALPSHEGAKALEARLLPDVAARAKAVEEFRPEIPVQEPIQVVAPVVVEVQEAPRRPVVDPIVEANKQFDEAMSASRLLTPAEQSAKHFVGVLMKANPDHELTQKARARLVAEFLSRANQSIEALDTDAADTWITEAELLEGGTDTVRKSREAWTDQLIAIEAAKPLPASALKVLNYVAPVYPERALERRVEGWVDVEFTVAPDGTVQAVGVVEASHENYFRREAVAAVQQWTFEPRVFMGRPIEQRSYTRIRFVD